MMKKLGFQKGLKNINIDSNSHLIYKKTNLSLVVLRPNDLAQMGDLIGQGNKDIIMWIGKTVGRSMAEIVDQDESPRDHQDLLLKASKSLENLGFGLISIPEYVDDARVKIKVDNPLYNSVDENQDILSMIYLGVFTGIFEHMGKTAQGVETEASWKDPNIQHSMFEFTIGGAGAE